MCAFLKAMLNGYKISFLATIFILFLLTGTAKVTFAETSLNSGFRVLVIHSYESGNIIYPEFNRMIADGFVQEGFQAEIRTFYLDCEQYPEAAETQRMYDYIDSMAPWKPDLILVNEDQATYSLLACEHPLVKTTPVVFSGVNFPNWMLLKKYTEITGFWDKPDYLETVNMVEQILGKTRIRFLHDDTYLGKQVAKSIAEQLKKKYPDVSRFLYKYLAFQEFPLSNPPVDLFQEDTTPYINEPDSTSLYFINLRKKGRNDLLWMLNGMIKYSAYIQTKYDYTTMYIGRMAVIPTFTVINEGFNYNQGVLGGYITTLDIQTSEMTKRAALILKGKKASTIPISQSEKKHVVDWNELERWHISQTTIPDNYEIVNIPFYIRYQSKIIIAITLVSILILSLIVYLSYLYSREARRKREAQLNLKKEKEFLSLALEGSNIFPWKYSLKQEAFTFDKDFFEYLKIPSHIFTRQQVWDIVHPDEYPEVLEQFRKVRNGEQDKAKVDCRCNFDGKGYVWYEFRYINVPTSDSMIGLILNIQDYKDRERQLTEARDLAAKAELKQSFLANMSHEIRTPLNAIVGFASLLTNDDEQTQEGRQEFINIINRNCELLLKLIEDILEISRIESNNLHFTFTSFDLNKLIEDIFSTHQMMIPANVQFLKEIPQTPVIIYSDKFRLNQVITNFINNAVKFTSSGSIMIGCKIDEVAKSLSIYVKDTGKGIPANEQKMIFERFYKRDEFIQGTGLGLSICQGIVKKLGGEISLESTEGKGSTFTITLPYAPEPEKQEESIPADVRVERTPGGNISENSRKTILIAEDNESNYMLLKTILQKHYDLVWVNNGKDAIKKTEEQSFDLVLMDIKMPEMNGLEALKEIRKKHKDLPVIMQTAYAFETDKEEAILAGCSGFLTKPIVASQLIAELRKL